MPVCSSDHKHLAAGAPLAPGGARAKLMGAPLMRPLLFLSLCLSVTAAARPWRGLEAGEATLPEVIKLFGQPSKTATTLGKDILAYYGAQVIEGTTQVQFRVDPKTQIVERIDVFPSSVIDKRIIKTFYGGPCPKRGGGKTPCYVQRLTKDGRLMYSYPRLDLFVFFNADGKSVFSFTYSAHSRPPAQRSSTGPDANAVKDADPTKKPPDAEAKNERKEEAKPPAGTEGGEAVTESTGMGEGVDSNTIVAEASDTPEGQTAQETAYAQLETTAPPVDPLKIGAQVYLRGEAGLLRQNGRNTVGEYAAPALIDAYFDGRPNDRVRAMVVGRLNYNAAASVGGFGQPGSNPSVALDQLWLRFDILRTLFVSVGKQHVKWGASRFWSPTDFLTPQHRDVLALFDERLGVDMLKLHLPWQSMGWNFYAIGTLSNLVPNGMPVQVGAAGRAEVVLGTSELSFTAVVGDNRRPRFGADLSSELGPVDVHGEVAVLRDVNQPLWRERATPIPSLGYAGVYETYTQERFLPQISAGVDLPIRLTEERNLILSAEGLYNGFGYPTAEIIPWLIATNTYEPLYAGRWYAALSLTYEGAGTFDNFRVSLTNVANLSDLSFLSRLDVVLRAFGELQVELFAEVPYGPLGGEFRLSKLVPLTDLGDGTFLPAVNLVPAVFRAGLGLRLKI